LTIYAYLVFYPIPCATFYIPILNTHYDTHTMRIVRKVRCRSRRKRCIQDDIELTYRYKKKRCKHEWQYNYNVFTGAPRLILGAHDMRYHVSHVYMCVYICISMLRSPTRYPRIITIKKWRLGTYRYLESAFIKHKSDIRDFIAT